MTTKLNLNLIHFPRPLRKTTVYVNAMVIPSRRSPPRKAHNKFQRNWVYTIYLEYGVHTRSIPGVKKRNEGFSVHCEQKVVNIFTSLYKVSSAEEKWYLNHSIWLGNFDSMPISGNTVIFEFRSTFATDEPRIMSGMAFHCCVVWKAYWSVRTKETRFNMISLNITMKGHSRHKYSLIGRKNRAKLENDRISRNGHRINITSSNLMI